MEMTADFLSLLREAPGYGLALLLLILHFKREKQVMEAFQAGVQMSNRQAETQQAIMSAVSSIADTLAAHSHALQRQTEKIDELRVTSALRVSQ